MPRDVDYSAVESRIGECISAAGDELLGSRTDRRGNTVAWVASRGDYNYTVTYSGGVDHLDVNFEYDIAQSVSAILGEDDAELVLQSEGIDTSELSCDERKLAAATSLLDNTPDDVKNRFGNDLIQIMSHPALAFNFKPTKNGGVSGFKLTKCIFPFSDRYQFGEFHEAVQTVVTLGHAASTYTMFCLNVKSALDDYSTVGPEPYIQ